MKKIFWTITCVLFVAAALSACTSGEFPTGTYTHNQFVTEYRDDGTFTMWENDEIVTEGTYSVKDDEITVKDSFCNDAYAGPATYKWSADDQGLGFEVIGEDRCEGRRDSLSVKWFGPK
jgi:hypothetical protein